MSEAVDEFVKKTLRLLQIEESEETESSEDCSETSVTVKNVMVTSTTSQMSHTLLEFHDFQLSSDYRTCGLIIGDVLGVRKDHDSKTVLLTGVLSSLEEHYITISVESDRIPQLHDDAVYMLVRMASRVTFKRMKKALANLRHPTGNPGDVLITHFFEEECLEEIEIPPVLLNKEGNLTFFTNLVDRQKEVVHYALKQKHSAIIHGPPGTGKTTTLVEIILQLVKSNQKVLVCAPSNVAVDNILEKLVPFKVKLVRIGHPSKILENVLQYSLDYAIQSADETSIIHDVKSELREYLRKLKTPCSDELRGRLGGEVKKLRREILERSNKIQKDLLVSANVILSTLISSSNDGPLKILSKEHFDVLIIDECSQALEAACWVAMPRASKVILAGDHLQLPPTVRSKEAMASKLGISLMERAVKKFGKQGYRMLTQQFRMNSLIMKWISQKFYEDNLSADPSVANHVLHMLPGVEEREETGSAVLLIDSAGSGFEESEDSTASKGNIYEAGIVAALVKKLIKFGVPDAEIGVITPYNYQARLIMEELSSYQTEVKSIDGFQGREKEAIIISFVRSNSEGTLGFITDERRINVAVSRARRCLAVIGDTVTLNRSPVLKDLIDYIETHGYVISAEDFSPDITIPRKSVQPDKYKVKMKSKKEGTKKNQEMSKQKKEPRQPTTNDANSSNKSNIDKEVMEWKATLEDLLHDKTEHHFPSYLSSFDRKLVHEAATLLGFQHHSVGEGTERHIFVSKNQSHQNVRCETQSPKVEKAINEQNEHEIAGGTKVQKAFLKSKLKKSKANKNCNVGESTEKQIVSKGQSQQSVNSEMLLSEVEQTPSEQNNLETADEKTIQKSSASKIIQKKNKKSNNAHSSIDETLSASSSQRVKKSNRDHENNEDFDAVCDEFISLNTTCCVRHCKISAEIMGTFCQFCKKRYCFSHSLPEVHGCGAEAKQAAMLEFRQSFKKQVEKRNTVEKRKFLSKKLENKIAEKASERKPKSNKQ